MTNNRLSILSMLPKPRKALGQHFLQDSAIIAHILSALSLKSNEHIVEIGPGRGALTLPLAKTLATLPDTTLDVVEFDRDLAKFLRAHPMHPYFTVHEGDATLFDFSSLKKDARKLRLLGNLPYNIATPLLFHLLRFAPIIQDMLFMLQKEVAERIAAKPHQKAYGRLSIMIQYHCNVAILFDVPKAAFYPPPNVTSSIINLIPYNDKPYIAQDFHLFSTVVKEAFNQRRKTLGNSLKKWVTQAAFSEAHIDPQRRPETLSIEEFVTLSNTLSPIPTSQEK